MHNGKGTEGMDDELADTLVCILQDIHSGRIMQAMMDLEELISTQFPKIGKQIPDLPLRDRQLQKAKPSLQTAMAESTSKTMNMSDTAGTIREYAERKRTEKIVAYQLVTVGNQEEEDGEITPVRQVWVYGGWRKIFKGKEENLLVKIQHELGIVGNKLVYDDLDWQNLPSTGFFKEVSRGKEEAST